MGNRDRDEGRAAPWEEVRPIMVNPETMETEEVEPSVDEPEVRSDPATMAIPIGPMSALDDLVAQIEEIVRTAKRMPLSSSAMIDRKQVLELVENLRRSIPEEVARARALLRDREAVLDAAHADAEQITERAKAERERLVEKTEIVQAAARKAEIMVAEAEAMAARIRAEADRYVEAKLANFEVVLQKTLAAVERGRARLASRIEEEQLSEQPDEEPFD